MPELVAQVEQPAAVIASQRTMIRAQMRDIVHQWMKPLFVRLGDIAASGILDFTEVAAERDLLLVNNVLVVKDEDGITVHPGLDRLDIGARQRRSQIDPGHLADKNRVDLADSNRHRTNSRKTIHSLNRSA